VMTCVNHYVHNSYSCTPCAQSALSLSLHSCRSKERDPLALIVCKRRGTKRTIYLVGGAPEYGP